MHHQIAIAVAASAQEVWEILRDLERWPSWTASMTSVTLEGSFEVGAVAEVRQPRLPRVRWTITELDPGRSFTWVSTAPGSRTVATHLVTPIGEHSSEVTLGVHQGGPLGSVLALAYRGLVRRYVQMEADGLVAEATRRYR